MCNRRNNEKGLKEYKKMGDCESQKGTLRQGSIPAKPRFRSVPDVADTKFANPCGFAH